MQRIRELDGLRAVAIFLVLGCHYDGFASLLGGLPEFGWAGVDIFFVLSGYLITTILLGMRGRPSPYRTFYTRRSARILPPYFVMLGTVFVIGLGTGNRWVLQPHFYLGQILFLQAFFRSSLVYVKQLLLHPYWTLLHIPSLLNYAHRLPKGAASGLIPELSSVPGIFWSLSIEEYFYLLWAPIVLHFSRRSLIYIGIVVCLIEMVLRSIVSSPIAYFAIFCRFDTLIYGAFLALLVERWHRGGKAIIEPRHLVRLFWVAAIVLGAIMFAIRPVIGYEIRQSPLFLVFGIPALSLGAVSVIGLLVFRSNTDWWLARLLRTRGMQAVGTVSYTMYLVHVLAGYIVAHAVLHLKWNISSHMLFAEALLSTMLTFAVARLSWHYFEKPLLHWKDRYFPGAPHPPEPMLE